MTVRSHTAGGALEGLLRRTHLSAPADLADVIDEQAIEAGALGAWMWLADLELDTLVRVPARSTPDPEALSIAGTVAGRSFNATTILEAPGRSGGDRRLWLPLLDGTERLGVLEVLLPATGDLDERAVPQFERFAHLAAMLVIGKGAYSDHFDVIRRRREMTVAAELTWSLAPPLVFATERLVVAGMLEPAYDNGGDALDYAVNGDVLHLGVFDAMGRGLAAAGVSSFAIAAYRHSRRRGLGLLETYAAMDAAVAEQFPDERFVTAVIAELQLETGELTWLSAGHPPPLLLRGGRRLVTLDAPSGRPLGLDWVDGTPVEGRESLEPGDLLLLYTDGLPEAQAPDGARFGVEALGEFLQREAAAGRPAPETLRRLRSAVLRDHGPLKDDATALVVEWRRDTARALVPPSVA